MWKQRKPAIAELPSRLQCRPGYGAFDYFYTGLAGSLNLLGRPGCVDAGFGDVRSRLYRMQVSATCFAVEVISAVSWALLRTCTALTPARTAPALGSGVASVTAVQA